MSAQTHIQIIGTSHISKHSAIEIERAIIEFAPDVVAVELDKRRLESLQTRKEGEKHRIPLSMVRQVGVTGYLFLVIGGVLQRKLAGIVDVEPGIDMLAAVNAATARNLTVLLVDQDILVTMRRLSAAFTWREKFRLLFDVMSAPFRREKIAINLEKVPSAATIRKLMGLLKDKYPSLYAVLIEERNIHMCLALDKFVRLNPEKRILLVVGAGHEEDLRERLARSERFVFS